jgi:hypothetical protein
MVVTLPALRLGLITSGDARAHHVRICESTITIAIKV